MGNDTIVKEKYNKLQKIFIYLHLLNFANAKDFPQVDKDSYAGLNWKIFYRYDVSVLYG